MQQIFDFISSHFHLTWGTGFLVLIFKAIRFLTKIEDRLINGEATLTKVATNDLPHIYEEMRTTNTNLIVQTKTMEGIRDLLLLNVKK